MAQAGRIRHAAIRNGDEEIGLAATEQDGQHGAHESLIARPAAAAQKVHETLRTQESGIIPVHDQEAAPKFRQLQLNRLIHLRFDGGRPAVERPVRFGFR
ncbi:MAG: hypothetical protein BGO51_04420 [Rhodospirillales bacterium 69-11]|nr:MAG: hypothetical protein BGO51_04420 [Rhodospirillales bacterium 69-11]